MTVRIRLSRHGAKKKPFYRIVVADVRAPRDGKFIERVGTFDPLKDKSDDSRLNLELDRIKQAALKKSSFSSAVNAEVARGKAAGLYIDRKIIKTGKLEDMSEQEIEAKMKQILDDYAQIIDVTPSKSSESSLPNDEESSSDPQK